MMKLFKRKQKNKEKKKKNYYRIVYICTFICIILFAVGCGVYKGIMINNDFKFQIQHFVDLVSVEIDQSQFIKNNSIRNEDYNTLKTKCQGSGFDCYSENSFDKTKFDMGAFDLSGDLNLDDYELGALMNLYESDSTNFVVEFLEVSIYTNSENQLVLYSVIKLDLPKILQELNVEQNNIKFLYLISENVITNSGEILVNNSLKINNLNGDDLKLVGSIVNSLVKNDAKGITKDNFSASSIIDFIKLVGIKTNSDYNIEVGEVSFTN